MKSKTLSKSKKEGTITLQLFVSGMSPKSMEAIENIRRLCDNQLKNLYHLEIIDIYMHPEAAIEHHIIFCPSLIKRTPPPQRILIGTLADPEMVLKALGVKK